MWLYFFVKQATYLNEVNWSGWRLEAIWRGRAQSAGAVGPRRRGQRMRQVRQSSAEPIQSSWQKAPHFLHRIIARKLHTHASSAPTLRHLATLTLEFWFEGGALDARGATLGVLWTRMYCPTLLDLFSFISLWDITETGSCLTSTGGGAGGAGGGGCGGGGCGARVGRGGRDSSAGGGRSWPRSASRFGLFWMTAWHIW